MCIRDRALAHFVALSLDKGVSHAAADDQGIDLLQQVGDDIQLISDLSACLLYTSHAGIHSLNGLDRSIEHAGVADHIAVCEVQDDHIVLAALDEMCIRDRPSAASKPESGTPMTTSASTGCSCARKRPACLRASCTELPSMTPVSYTHLDVYKRQGRWR